MTSSAMRDAGEAITQRDAALNKICEDFGVEAYRAAAHAVDEDSYGVCGAYVHFRQRDTAQRKLAELQGGTKEQTT